MLHNSADILRGRLSSPSVIKNIGLICEKIKDHTYRDLKTMEESINLAVYTWVVIERIVVRVTELGYVPL